MQYTPHYNLNIPEGTDIVNPLIQDNPNYTAIDTALYNNKLRVVGTATHVKTGTNHAITLGDSDINQFKFVATGDYATGDTFTVDGVTVTARIADGSSIPSGAFKINSTVFAILDGTILNLMNVDGTKNASGVYYDNTSSALSANNVQDAIDELHDADNIIMSDGVTSVEDAINSISYKKSGLTGTTTAEGLLPLTGFEYANGFRILCVESCTLDNVTYTIAHGATPNYIVFNPIDGSSVANKNVTVVFYYVKL